MNWISSVITCYFGVKLHMRIVQSGLHSRSVFDFLISGHVTQKCGQRSKLRHIIIIIIMELMNLYCERWNSIGQCYIKVCALTGCLFLIFVSISGHVTGKWSQMSKLRYNTLIYSHFSMKRYLPSIGAVSLILGSYTFGCAPRIRLWVFSSICSRSSVRRSLVPLFRDYTVLSLWCVVLHFLSVHFVSVFSVIVLRECARHECARISFVITIMKDFHL